jgi:hypothetical protein
MKISVIFDNATLSPEQIEQINKLLPFAEKYTVVEEKPVYSNHIRNMTKGWERICSISEWCEQSGPFVPGTYALCWDPKGTVENPVCWSGTLLFGETTQPAWKRIASHAGALRGTRTNTREKWLTNLEKFKKYNNGLVLEHNLDKISILFRPHEITDNEFKYDREHSLFMEKQAHAQFKALWGRGTIFNSRDLPDYYLIENAKKELTKLGFTCK